MASTRLSVPVRPMVLPRRWRVDRFHVAALLVIVCLAWAYLHRLDAWLINDDEESYLYAAWRISQGELPYRDFLTPQLPAFLFPGALMVKVFGRDPWMMRAWSVALTLVAGGATYLTGRKLFGPMAGLAALVLCLAMDDVFAIGRAFRPEATMLACGTLALYVFVRADAAGRRAGYALGSLLFGGALLAKLFGVLPWLATLAFVGWQVLRGQRERRAGLWDLVALALPGALLASGVMGAFRWLTPATYTAVLGHHLMQGQQLSAREVLAKNLVFYMEILRWHAAVLASLPLGIAAIRRLAPRHGWVVVWQLPTIAVFLFLSRELWARHLVYLLPALGLIVGAGVAWIAHAIPAERRMAWLAAATLLGAVALPYVVQDTDAWERREIGTARLASLVRTLAPADSRILADNPGIGFYAGRTTTYSGAGISEGAAESGQITGERLLGEMRADGVSLVLIDRASEAGQLVDLHDFDAFDAAVKRDYVELGTFLRYYQRNMVYLRKDLPHPAVDFGWGSLIGVDLGGGAVESGGELDVILVFQVRQRPDRQYTAFLHLDDPQGSAWGQGDGLLDNAIYRGTEEWEPGELVAVPLKLRVEPGTPPGTYRLRLGLYEAATGQRLSWTAPDQGGGDAWEAGAIEVTLPSRPPNGSTDTLLGALAGDAEPPPTAARPSPGAGPSGPYRLLATRHAQVVQAGSELPVRLTWRADRPPAADHTLRLALAAADGTILAQTDLSPPSPGWPTSAWRAGEVATTSSGLLVDPGAPGGAAALSAAWLDASGVPLDPPDPAGEVEITPLGPPVTTVPEIPRPVDARLGTAIQLLGSDLPESARPGEPLPFALTWRADARVPEAYAVLVHVVRLADVTGEDAGATAVQGADAAIALNEADPPIEADAPIAAQADGPPAGGARPTTSWRPGEVITDPREIPLPADLAPGRYVVLIGLYDPDDPGFARLPAELGGSARPGGRVPIGVLTVGP